MSKDNIELKDVIHLYLGCEVMATVPGDSGNKPYILNEVNKGIKILCKDGFIKPILRKLDSMTDKDIKPMPFKQYPDFENKKFTPDQFVYLLSKGFDLFNLIKNNLAIDKNATP